MQFRRGWAGGILRVVKKIHNLNNNVILDEVENELVDSASTKAIDSSSVETNNETIAEETKILYQDNFDHNNSLKVFVSFLLISQGLEQECLL